LTIRIRNASSEKIASPNMKTLDLSVTESNR
jgi:hypothetical protein